MMRATTLVLGLAFALAALAPGAQAAPLGEATGLVPAATSRIDIAVNQGQLVHLSKPVNSVFIADPTIADVEVKSPTLVYVIGKAAGSTTLYAVSEQDEVVLNTQVRVSFDASRVEQTIHDLVPRSEVKVMAIADSLVLTGTAYSASDGDDIRNIAARFVKDPKQLVNKMSIDAPNQVNLRVRVAEVDRNIIKQFGINWENTFNNGSIVFGLATGGASLIANNVSKNVLPNGGSIGAPTAGTGISPPSLTANPPTLATLPIGASSAGYNVLEQSQLGGQTNNNLFGGVNTKNLNINSLVDALDNHGLVTVLAEPNLTALSGEPASFLAGGEFPVPVPAGTGLVGIDWKNFGVSLNFVATVTNGDRISLHVMPEVSELSTAGAIMIAGTTVPALTTRRAETTVELASGQTFAIGGLLQNNVTQNINKFPWLGDVPVLGQLFRSEAFQRQDSELVILVTPYIVHPIATANRAMMPTDGFVPSTDAQFVLHANEFQSHGPAAPAPASGGSNLIGPVGFDLE
jgi:pilus assembly protein CpaC